MPLRGLDVRVSTKLESYARNRGALRRSRERWRLKHKSSFLLFAIIWLFQVPVVGHKSFSRCFGSSKIQGF